jgi:Carboxypeptidase regulatory-like domain
MTNLRALAFLAALACGAVAYAQTEASVSGTVTDPTGAHVVAASVTALNTATGIATPATTNDAGVYTMPGLPPGKYTFTAEHPGFRREVMTEVDLQVGTVMVLNMGLELGQTSESVEVQATATEVNATSASVGNVVDARRLEELPLNGRSSYDLLLTQPGVVQGTNFYLNGAQGGSVNFTTDGLTTMDNLHQSQFYLYSNVSSVDRVEEFRVVTSPADAEYGRGSGQVQMVTRAGGNKFNGSAFYEVRNAEFNANNFFNNLAGVNAAGQQVEPRSQLKQNNYGIRFGGPVKRNKMFFNGIYEPYKQRNFTTVNETVYTPSALAGNFRFYPGVIDGNSQAATPTVNAQGQPVQPSSATGPLQTVNVFGRDPLIPGPDTTGAIAHFLSYMPLPNNYLIGDGLNTAGFTWNQPTPVNFELYEGRIDYNFDEKEHLAITLSQQSYHSFNVATPPPYPTVPGQADPTETTTYTAALNSVIRPNLLNELRMGIFRTRTIVETPYGGTSTASQDLLSTIGGQPVLVYPAATNYPVSGPDGNLGIPGNYLDPTYQYGDNVTWIKGKHSFKAGAQLRFISLAGYDFTTGPTPIMVLGAPPLAPLTNISTGSNPIAGIGSNANAASGLLETLGGTLLEEEQINLSPGGKNPVFLPGQTPYHNYHQNEADWYVKDDWKITPSLTLNLGVRWELYLPPTEEQGKGVAPIGNSQALFGISGTTMASLFNPNATGGSQSVVQGIGPGTANPGAQYYRTDYKNFAPALGLAWAVPGRDGMWKWLSGGPNKMTIRMGYGISYQRLPIGLVAQDSGAEPGLSQTTVSFASTSLSNAVVPVQPTGVPLSPVPESGTGSHTASLYAYDYNLRTPYTQNYNFTITRALTNSLYMDVAFVGSSSHELVRTADTNEVNIYENGILNAFNTVLAGGDSPLIDQIFNTKYSAVAAAGSGSKYVLTNSATNGFFATNNPGGFANYISTTTALAGSAGALLTNAGLPLNFIVANPQFLHTYLTGNFGNSTYNSLQVQVVKRFAKGFSTQGSYVFSKALGADEGDSQGFLENFRTLTNESLDKRPLSFDYQSVFKLNGLYELPFGKGKQFAGNSNTFVDRIIGGWQIGAIAIAYSGQPITLTAQNTINNTSAEAGFTPQLLGSLPGHGVTTTGNGVIYFNGLTQVLDPSIASMPTSVQGLSTLRAIAGANGQPLLVNPLPGVMGALGNGVLFGPGGKQLNANVIKRIRINERFTFQIGATAENVTNTPIFANPNTNINSTAFGRITATAGLSGAGGSGGATASRLMVIQARLNF